MDETARGDGSWLHRFAVAAGHQDAGMQPRGGVVVDLACRVIGQQVPDNVVVHTEAAQQHVARCDLEYLRRRQVGDQVGRLFGHAQAKQCFGPIRANQVLRQHQIGEIGFAYLGQNLLIGHIVSLVCTGSIRPRRPDFDQRARNLNRQTDIRQVRLSPLPVRERPIRCGAPASN